jgi:hypothetical protein
MSISATRVWIMVAALAVLQVSAPAARDQNGQARPATVPATADNAASFLGEWTITASSTSYGNTTMTLTLKAADGKVAGEAADTNGRHPFTDVSKSGDSLIAAYAFDYQGTAVDAIVTLTPNEKDKTVDAYLDFANGAALFVGTATKK